MSPIRKRAREIYRKTMLESWLIGLLTGLLITGLLALNILAPGTFLIIIPLLCLPLMFAAHVVHIHAKTNTITFMDTLRGFTSYFVRPFNSTFSFFMSLLKSVGVFFALEITLSFIGQPVTFLINHGINDSLEQVNALMSSEAITWNDLLNVIYANNYALLIYLCIVLIPAFVFAFIAFIYFASRSSQSLYLRLRYRDGNPQFIKYVHSYFIATNRGRTIKDYLSLNWPLYVLLLLGAIGGTVGMSFLNKDPLKLIAAAFTGAALFATFFLPFYLCNHEAIGECYMKDYEDSINHVNEMITKSMEMQMARTKEEQERLQEALTKAREQMKEENNAQEEENNNNEESDSNR